jgi:hypothetical protein
MNVKHLFVPPYSVMLFYFPILCYKSTLATVSVKCAVWVAISRICQNNIFSSRFISVCPYSVVCWIFEPDVCNSDSTLSFSLEGDIFFSFLYSFLQSLLLASIFHFLFLGPHDIHIMATSSISDYLTQLSILCDFSHLILLFASCESHCQQSKKKKLLVLQFSILWIFFRWHLHHF